MVYFIIILEYINDDVYLILSIVMISLFGLLVIASYIILLLHNHVIFVTMRTRSEYIIIMSISYLLYLIFLFINMFVKASSKVLCNISQIVSLICLISGSVYL